MRICNIISKQLEVELESEIHDDSYCAEAQKGRWKRKAKVRQKTQLWLGLTSQTKKGDISCITV